MESGLGQLCGWSPRGPFFPLGACKDLPASFTLRNLCAMYDPLSEHFHCILQGLGEDPSREGLRDTPQRASKALRYLCHGYDTSLEELVNGALFSSTSDEMVMVQDIELYSLCEHHLLPFIGQAHVAYIPTGKVLGLSKVARIVDMYARRLQIQEQLTRYLNIYEKGILMVPMGLSLKKE